MEGYVMLKYYEDWTPEEEESLISLYPDHTFREIATQLGRTKAAVQFRAIRLRREGRLGHKRNQFTPEQDMFIRTHRHSMTLSEVASHLGRKSRTDIANRAKRLGVTYCKYGDLNPLTKYSDSDVGLIRALRDDGMTFSKIAEKFEMPESTARSIYHKRFTAADAIAREYLPR
ncbi:AsnC family protein [Salmonella enterica]|uniref:AsnC family protein n=1 Tax=Salmonella enterica TaxID=28901 RepID=A0A3J2D1W6_SALER|nr:AsnC family protein [Salmonella enterica]EAW1340891.1 AsnC family protein [Salmonella enterica subsp. enterica]EBG6801583.1 AsnC family protein [Salmonella enterica subsp. enterica serovar Newport]ECA3231778.1 AsnC family protein [Salmonella enterica subsp. enterica serovar Infantis]ECM0309125.1 AsnC family protein [Salmonella enterica subsp. enterica serovar Muenchen]ECM5342453.1 AsnC family protein [Salmonella enterica subsp. enterica serovar Give]ECU9638095.1 AsnC family protein [Salmon